MKLTSLVLLLGLGVCAIAVQTAYKAQRHTERLAAENQELRLRDANRARLKDLRKGRVNPNGEAIANAAYDMGTMQSLLDAVARQEAGGPVYELGHGGKTALIWQCVPPDQTQAYEAARTLNKALWAWAWSDKARRREAIKALGKAYTHPEHAKTWARNVDKLEKQRHD